MRRFFHTVCVAALTIGLSAPAPADDPRPPGGDQPPQVARDQLAGSIHHGGGDAELKRVAGKVRVIDPTTIEFADGTRIDLDLVSPNLEQMALRDGALYPCGRAATEFLRKLIGDQTVQSFRYIEDEGPWWSYVGDVSIEHAMIINGWALADHSSTQAAEVIARETKRGLWRGEFTHPHDWHAGVRLPGEPPPAALTDERQANALIQRYGRRGAGLSALVARIVNDLPGAKRLSFAGTGISDGDLARLMRLTTLEELDLWGCGSVSDKGLECLKSMRRLKQLYLPVLTDDAALEHVAHLGELVELRVGHWAGRGISDEGLKHLAGLSKLRRLLLYNLEITDAGLAHLRGAQDLAVLELGRIHVSDAGMPHLAQLKNLRYLDISDTQVTDAGAQQLAGLKRLRVLALPDTVSDAAKARLRETLPDLRFEGTPEEVLSPQVEP
jgi:endonuclease YncB( thermonuclease family)